jgi:ATP synthase in type III secretion protein N
VIARGAGCVVRTHGETVSAALPGARVGDGVLIRSAAATLRGEVAAVERLRVSIAPFGAIAGIAVGDRVQYDPEALCFPVGFAPLGRALDATGEPLDARPPVGGSRVRIERCGAPAPREREPISAPLWTGVRAIDGLLTLGRGARIGLFGAPGAGKTMLLESIVAAARADAVVIALVGERGREAQAWCARLDRRTTIVCATSDRSAPERVRAAGAAMAQAEHLRAAGLHVVMIVDSLARYAAALREQHVALGEPVGRGGYPPGVWSAFARYLERAGNGSRGSITLFATVLSDGADEREPVSDAARSLLDGHVALSSALARAGHFPAIDVLESTSRTMHSVVSNDHARDAQAVRSALALLAQTADARAVGLAVEGSALRTAVGAQAAFEAFLRQSEPCAPEDTLRSLRSLASLLEPRR